MIINDLGNDNDSTILVCGYCGNYVDNMGPDGISVCNEGGCGIVEGSTRYVTIKQWEDYQCD